MSRVVGPAPPHLPSHENRKWYRNWAVSQILIETMEEMKLAYPQPRLNVQALKQRTKAVA